MKHSTYIKLRNAFLGAVDEKGLLQSLNEETDPFYQNLIKIIVNKTNWAVYWDVKPFTTEFLSGSPQQRLDETFFAFVLRVIAIVKEEIYIRMYRKPESHHVILAWVAILRNLILSSLGLLYNVRWTPETIIGRLESTIMKIFSEGDVLALRRLMTDLGITLAQKELYQAENSFRDLSLLLTSQFGSFYWRFLHWMAEAVALRGEEAAWYKNIWLELLKGPLYRTLRCTSCMDHFKHMLTENEAQLFEKYDNLPLLFFNFHNKTHAIRRENSKFLHEPDYTDAQYQADSKFMREALLAK